MRLAPIRDVPAAIIAQKPKTFFFSPVRLVTDLVWEVTRKMRRRFKREIGVRASFFA